MKSRWIEHKGKRIFFSDCSNFGADSAALREEVKAIIAVVTCEPVDSVLALSDVEGTIGTPENMTIMKGVVSRTTRHVRQRAVVGVAGVRRTLLDIVNRLTGAKRFAAFSDMEAAKDWLVREET